MTTIAQFRRGARVRYDFGDMIMVRYTIDGEDYDTWVSGEEVLQRAKSANRERQIKAISQLEWDEIKDIADGLPDRLKQEGRRGLKDFLADQVEDAIGGNVIGDSIADNIRGHDSNIDESDKTKQRWQQLLRQPGFREIVLQLAWLNLRGSLPDDNSGEMFDDWV